MANKVFIATSLDGYIADKNEGLQWLDTIENKEGSDMGYAEHMDSVDALLMGRKSVETVLGFDVPWPYEKPVFMLSNSRSDVPQQYEGRIIPISGELAALVEDLKLQGYQNLYVDGGTTITSMLEQDLIDEMIITIIPLVLGGGIPLFGQLSQPRKFKHIKSLRFNDAIVQNHFVRDRG